MATQYISWSLLLEEGVGTEVDDTPTCLGSRHRASFDVSSDH
jgi:hypothetical protein